MATPIEVNTPDNLEYNFFPHNTGFLQFRVRTTNDAHVALTTGACVSDPMYELFIGGWGNAKSVIRKNRSKPDCVEVETPGILDGGEFRGFWLRWGGNNIQAGREGEQHPFISWTDSEYVPINYVGVCTGWGASGSWIVEQNAGGQSQGQFGWQGGNAGGGCTTCWVGSANGSVPPGAFVGGEDNGEPLYIARSTFQGGLIPGKLVASHGTAYIPWGGVENAVPQYEVLCGVNGNWLACSGGNVPSNAVPGGQTEDGETLYIGRVIHEGTLTIGKVQQSHGVCYIPYAGQELNYQQFEVLVA